jgi:glycosyltransferase involved in cell wall biosynthesis
MTDILCFSTTDWDEIWGSRQQIMARLAAAGHRVLFVERQVGPEHLLRDPDLRFRKLKAWRMPAVRALNKNLWLWQPPLLPPGRYYSTGLNRLGQSFIAARLRPVLHELAFKQPLLWLYPPHSAPLIGRFSERLVVYHCIERFIGGQRGRKRNLMQAQEADLLRYADRVFVHTEGLRRLYQPISHHPIILVPSAADVAHFQSTNAVHPDISALPHPRLGVSGTLDARLDVSLINTIASNHPEWQLILIGQVRPGRIDLAPLKILPNVHILGPRRFADLPALLNGMDALLIPYLHNELTEYISPIKLYEYLAVGKSIISVDLPGVRPLQDWVSLAKDQPGFIRAIQRALDEDDPQRYLARRKAALEHTWEARIKLMWDVISIALAEGRYAAH